MKKALFAFLLFPACLAFPFATLASDRSGLWELSPFVGFNRFDGDLGGKTGFALGARGGYFLTDKWEGEVELLRAKADNDGGWVSLKGASLGALYNPRIDSLPSVSPYLCAGLGYDLYEYDDVFKTGKEHEWSLHYGLGARYALSERLALRGDVRQIVTFEPARPNLLATLGLSWFFGIPAAPVAQPEPEPPAVAQAEPPAQLVPAAEVSKAVDGDADGDGVPDSRDKCPNTPHGAKVDADGCLAAQETPRAEEQKAAVVAKAEEPKAPAAPKAEPPKPAAPEVKEAAPIARAEAPPPKREPKKLELSLLFGLNSASVDKKYNDEVAKLARFMADNPSARINIEGYADSTGDDAYNKALSERRAKNLSRILTKTYKIAPERISTAGYGEDKPVASNKTRAGRAQNRRVLAVVTAD